MSSFCNFAFPYLPFITQDNGGAHFEFGRNGLTQAHRLPTSGSFVERLFLLRYSATALAEERAFPLAIPTLVGGLIVSPEQNQQQ